MNAPIAFFLDIFALLLKAMKLEKNTNASVSHDDEVNFESLLLYGLYGSGIDGNIDINEELSYSGDDYLLTGNHSYSIDGIEDF